MIEEKKQRKNKVIKVVALLGLFLMVFGISYALFKVTLNGNKTNKITTGKMDLYLTDKNGVKEEDLPEGVMGINLEGSNAVPMSAEEAVETIEPYEFNLVNNGTIGAQYTLYFKVDGNLPANKVKYRLERTDTGEVISHNFKYFQDDSNEPNDSISGIPSLQSKLLSLEEASKDTDNKDLYKIEIGSIAPQTTQKFSLKMWVAYAAGTEINDKEMNMQLKIDAEQLTKNEAYVTLEKDVTSEEDRGTFGQTMMVKKYSDDSIRISGIGDLNRSNELYYQTMIDYQIESSVNLNKANKILNKYGVESYDSIVEMFNDIDNTSCDDDCINEILETVPDLENPRFDLYIEDGILTIENELFENMNIRNLYISKTVSTIGSSAFRGCNLEKVIFTEVVDDSYLDRDLTIREGAFSSNSNLKEVLILDNLKEIGYINDHTNQRVGDIFGGCTQADVKIKALSSNVQYSTTQAFKDVKSLTWING